MINRQIKRLAGMPTGAWWNCVSEVDDLLADLGLVQCHMSPKGRKTRITVLGDAVRRLTEPQLVRLARIENERVGADTGDHNLYRMELVIFKDCAVGDKCSLWGSYPEITAWGKQVLGAYRSLIAMTASQTLAAYRTQEADADNADARERGCGGYGSRG